MILPIVSNPNSNIKKRKRFKLFREDISYHIMVLPAILLTLAFCYAPMFGIIIAFKEFSFRKGFFRSDWKGLYYFAEFFKDFRLPNVVLNSFILGILSLFFGTLCTIGFALMLNELRNLRFKRLVQTITYFPHFISYVIVVVILGAFLAGDGLVNQMLMSLKLSNKAILFLAWPQYYWGVVVATGIWKSTGWSAIIYIAAMAGIDPELYESAVIDGATRWHRIWYITLPCILPTICILLILGSSGILNVGFQEALLLGNVLNAERSTVLSYYIYTVGIQSGNYSYSTALGLVTAIFSASFMVISNTISKSLTKEGLF